MKNTISMNVSAIGTDDGKSTFEVQRTWNEKGKKAIAIGMYPTISVENCGMLDVSNMHLLNHANDFFSFGYSALFLLRIIKISLSFQIFKMLSFFFAFILSLILQIYTCADLRDHFSKLKSLK